MKLTFLLFMVSFAEEICTR